MKTLLALLTGASLLLMSASGMAAEKGNPETQLKALFDKIQDKLQKGESEKSALSTEIKEFDTLLAEHKGNKSDEVAQILVMKALLFIQVFEETESGIKMLESLKKDFPETTQGKQAEEMITSIKKKIETDARVAEIQKGLAVGKPFPDFNEKDLNGNPLSVSQFKGKVVLVDFWATWCGPCIAELPNVLQTYEKYNKQGFEIIGISLDRTEDKLTSFVRKRKMTWPHYFDGDAWQSKLVAKYGIQGIPATFLIDQEGNIAAKNLRGPALEEEVAKLLK